jgi:hypothetical protein
VVHNNEVPSRSRRSIIAGSLTGAGLVAGAAIFGQATPAMAAEAGLVVIAPSLDTSGNTDRANIQAALGTTGSQVILTPGTFYINGPIVMHSNQRLIGSGAGATTINQVTDDHGISSTPNGNINYVTIAGLTLNGIGAGNGSGIYFVPVTTGNVTDITIEDCIVKHWGDCGVYLSASIASRITRVEAFGNGGDGFYITKTSSGAGTSIIFQACYANANVKNGYELDTVSYSSFSGCASDGNRTGYALFGCRAVTLTSSGAENFTTAGYLFSNCISCCLFGGYTYAGHTVGIHVAGSTTHQTIGGAVQSTPDSATTNFILTDAGTSTLVWGISRPGTAGTSTDTFNGTVTNLDGSA